jgi:hypothetical protein
MRPAGDRRTIVAVGKVGKADHRLVRDTQHFVEDALRGMHRLQRLRDDHVIERLVLEA